MFNRLKTMINGGDRQPQQPAQRTFSQAEAKAIELAHGAVHMQLIMSSAGKDGDPSCKIYREEHVTPWVVGYMSGILDFATRVTQPVGHADIETLRLFWKLHFADEVMTNVTAAFLTGQDAISTGNDIFGHGEQFQEGAKAGFNCIPRSENEAPRLDLARELQGSKSNA